MRSWRLSDKMGRNTNLLQKIRYCFRILKLQVSLQFQLHSIIFKKSFCICQKFLMINTFLYLAAFTISWTLLKNKKLESYESIGRKSKMLCCWGLLEVRRVNFEYAAHPPCRQTGGQGTYGYVLRCEVDSNTKNRLVAQHIFSLKKIPNNETLLAFFGKNHRISSKFPSLIFKHCFWGCM